MKRRNSLILSAAATVIMLLGCFYCRYVLEEWRESANSVPTYLLIVGTAAAVIAFFCKGKFTQPFSAFGYIVGLFAGYFFNTDGADPGGGRTNNMWIIWCGVFIAFMIIGIVIDMMKTRSNKNAGKL